MIVDGSYMAWVRPTRRVHLALSAGMTVTGLILTVVGLTGGGGGASSSPQFGRSADSVVPGDSGRPAGAVAPAPMVRFAPAAPAAPSAKPHKKPASPAAPTPHHAAHPADVTRLPVPAPMPAPAPSRAPAPAPPRALEKLPEPSPAPHRSPEPRRVHPAEH